MTLDIGRLVAGTKYRGEFEERLKKLMEEIRQNDNIILFIDEVHTLIGAGAAEGAIDAANILKPALARGEMQCIGATTLDEYRKHIEKDPALERRFQPVKVPEPTVDETIQILGGLRERYEIHHKLRYTDEAIAAAAQLSHQYIRESPSLTTTRFLSLLPPSNNVLSSRLTPRGGSLLISTPTHVALAIVPPSHRVNPCLTWSC
ncbi:ATP-dependent Clp protease ATP-binding subunit ClpC1 [Orobanche gracilis]